MYLVLYRRRGGQIIYEWLPSYDAAASYISHLRGRPSAIQLEVYEVTS